MILVITATPALSDGSGTVYRWVWKEAVGDLGMEGNRGSSGTSSTLIEACRDAGNAIYEEWGYGQQMGRLAVIIVLPAERKIFEASTGLKFEGILSLPDRMEVIGPRSVDTFVRQGSSSDCYSTHGAAGYQTFDYWEGSCIVCGFCKHRIVNPQPTGGRLQSVKVEADGFWPKLAWWLRKIHGIEPVERIPRWPDFVKGQPPTELVRRLTQRFPNRAKVRSIPWYPD